LSKDVVFFIDNLNSGGAQKQITLLCNLFANRRQGKCYLVHYGVESTYWNNYLMHENIEVCRLIESTILGRVREFYALMVQLQVKKIVAFLFIPGIIVTLANLIAFFRWDVVYSERSFEANTRPIFNLIPRQFYRFAKAVTVNSLSQYDVLRKKSLGLGDRLYYIPNGLIIEDGSFLVPQNLEILAIGRVSYNKGTDNLIKVLKALHDSGLDIARVKWIGAKEDTKFFEDCVVLIEKYRLTEYWTWIDPIPNLDDYYRSSSLLVHLSRGEGFPNVVCEALGKGLNVVLFDVNDHSIFVGKDCGYLANLDDNSMVAEAISNYYYLPPEERLKRKYSAVHFAQSAFSLDKYFNSYNDLTK